MSRECNCYGKYYGCRKDYSPLEEFRKKLDAT